MSGPIGLSGLVTFAHGLDHPEGIAIADDGATYVGGEAGQIYRVGGDDIPHQIASTGGFVLGLALDGENRLYACDEIRAAVLRVDLDGANVEQPDGLAVEVFCQGTAERPMRVPNWGAFDALGNYYVSDSGDWGSRNGWVWVVRPGGTAEVWTEEPTNFPNGLAVAPDGSRIYLVESSPARIVEIPIYDDGSAGPLRELCDLGQTVPDGIAVAADGALVVSFFRPDAISRWAIGDGLDLVACDPLGMTLSAPTNVAFTGDGLDVVVVPNLAASYLTRGRLDGIAGTRLFRPGADLLES